MYAPSSPPPPKPTPPADPLSAPAAPPPAYTDGGSNSGSSTDSGSSTSTGSGASGSSSGASSIPALTTGIKGLQSKGVDLKLSPQVANEYISAIKTLNDQLTTVQGKIKALKPFGSPGTLTSAQETAGNLQTDITGFTGLETSVSQFIAYLGEFETTVQKATNTLLASG